MALTANVKNSMRKEVYKRDGYRCALCDSTDGLQIHHIRPRGQGGANHPMNMICLCWRCHNAAHGSMVDDSILGILDTEIDPEILKMKPAVRRAVIAGAMELEICRYMGDLYAEQGEVWYPWEG